MLKLKYLFTATYKDGSVYQQTPEDKSIKDPEKRNCFFDLDVSKLAKFTLKEVGGGLFKKGNEFSVDLIDGHFEVNGVSFYMPQEVKTPMNGFKLIYFINNQIHTDVTYEKKSGDVVNTGNQRHERRWLIGWQCTVEGKNYQEVMQIE